MPPTAKPTRIWLSSPNSTTPAVPKPPPESQTKTARRPSSERSSETYSKKSRSARAFLTRPLVGSRWTAVQGPLARKAPTLLLSCKRIAESLAKVSWRARVICFARRGLICRCIVEFGELG
jgi:hypothetical protein